MIDINTLRQLVKKQDNAHRRLNNKLQDALAGLIEEGTDPGEAIDYLAKQTGAHQWRLRFVYKTMIKPGMKRLKLEEKRRVKDGGKPSKNIYVGLSEIC